MASIKIHGGDFVAGRSGTFSFGVLTLPTPYDSWHGIPVSRWEKIPFSKVMRVEAVNKEMKHRTGAAVGRGLVGGMLGWPMGAVASVLGGPPGVVVGLTSALIGFTMTNHRSNVTFEAEFEGGRRLLATTNTATYTKLLAAAFNYKPPQEQIGNVNGEPDNDVRSSGVALPAANSAPPPTEVQAKIDLKLLIAYILGIFVLVGIINRSPLAWGIAVGGIVFIVGRTIWPR